MSAFAGLGQNYVQFPYFNRAAGQPGSMAAPLTTMGAAIIIPSGN
jgi:hypothetical protein